MRPVSRPPSGTADTSPSSGHDHADHSDHYADATSERRWWQGSKARLTLLSGAPVGVAYAASLMIPDTAIWVFIAATEIAAFPIARCAVAAARTGTLFSIETLMVITAAGAIVIGAAEEAAVVVFLFLIGELPEGYAAEPIAERLR